MCLASHGIQAPLDGHLTSSSDLLWLIDIFLFLCILCSSSIRRRGDGDLDSVPIPRSVHLVVVEGLHRCLPPLVLASSRGEVRSFAEVLAYGTDGVSLGY